MWKEILLLLSRLYALGALATMAFVIVGKTNALLHDWAYDRATHTAPPPLKWKERLARLLLDVAMIIVVGIAWLPFLIHIIRKRELGDLARRFFPKKRTP